MGFIWTTTNNKFVQQNIDLYRETPEGINIILGGRSWVQIMANYTEAIVEKLPVIIKYKISFENNIETELTFIGTYSQKMVTDVESLSFP